MDGFKDFNHTNVCKSLIILLNEFFPGENCDKTINWEVVEDHSHKVTFRKNNASDHHLNMLHRLSLIPPSYRGNQFRKYLADQRSIKGMQLSEYLDIVCGRWQTHCQRRS